MRKAIQTYLPYIICLLFFVAYATLSVVRHNHFLTGYDLSISDQAIWLMAHFESPVLTQHAYAYSFLFADHVEVIYAFLSPMYWFIDDVRILLVLQALAISVSGIPVYLLAKEKKVIFPLRIALLISFLLFYGIQQAIWSDVHSLVFAASFFPWFIYFLEKRNHKLTFLFFFLLLSCKEDIALLTFLVSGIFYLRERVKIALVLMVLSVVYLGFMFGIYFPYFAPNGYLYAKEGGLLSGIDIANMYNTAEKRDVLLYSSLWFGLLPLFAPLYLIPVIGDLAHYFVLGNSSVMSAQGMFMHYRVTLAVLLVWPTILVISRYKRLNTKWMAVYLLACALFLQYHLHLPLSYLTKQWFWTTPESVRTVGMIVKEIPRDAAVVTQINLQPHLSHRKEILTLWPEKKKFVSDPPCGQEICEWLRWTGNPSYMVVDISTNWDARHFLTDRETFISAVANLEKAGIIVKEKQSGNTILYTIVK